MPQTDLYCYTEDLSLLRGAKFCQSFRGSKFRIRPFLAVWYVLNENEEVLRRSVLHFPRTHAPDAKYSLDLGHLDETFAFHALLTRHCLQFDDRHARMTRRWLEMWSWRRGTIIGNTMFPGASAEISQQYDDVASYCRRACSQEDDDDYDSDD